MVILNNKVNEPLKVGFVSLGCPKNQLDTEVMLKELYDEGYEIVSEETEADIIIINTCAFIESAKKEAIDNILDIAWLKQHHTLKGIVVTGCLAERYRDEIFKELPEVDALLGVGSIHSVCKAVSEVAKGRKFSEYNDKNTVALGGERIITTPEYTAYLKISEGCDNKCSYCAIPSIRGKFRSRPMEDILAEAKELCESGELKELCIVAQDTTRYGVDLYGKYALAELLQKLCDETTVPWIRILYCYPDKITDELIEVIKKNDKIVKYMDLPIQHFSDPVLKRMNRHGDSALIREVFEKIRREIPDIVIRTTAIVGFPGETDEDFTKLCEFVKEMKLEHFGAFTYSREEDTPAYDLEDQIDEQLKQDRYDIIMKMQLEINAAVNEKRKGQELKVLVEGYDEVAEAYAARSYADAPDIDSKVYFVAKRGQYTPGDFVRVKITDVCDYDLVGEVL
ncbi:MAG: 30S ribosomal protein S12 methylthiotransferase RimO [Ruminococcaceae bacterium]|nr:30S ribosomal protein S12 methylthiotransferase RimO [Oscillospiraceae bacterium]